MNSPFMMCRQGLIKRDCPNWVGGRVPQPEKRRWQVPRAVCWVREPRQAPVCWTCGQVGHFWRDCPGPRNVGQGNPGGSRTTKRRPKATRRQGVCWGCQKPGHIRRHCPLKRLEVWLMEVPGTGAAGGTPPGRTGQKAPRFPWVGVLRGEMCSRVGLCSGPEGVKTALG
uniref:CCHC-type domain-containing protein n=1 Tax=Gopherus evgoodei TaxID=1825980 RepID=A0A8C4YGJ5_9SAUR